MSRRSGGRPGDGECDQWAGWDTLGALLDRCAGTPGLVDADDVVPVEADEVEVDEADEDEEPNQEPSSGSTSIGWNGSAPVPGDEGALGVADGLAAGLVASPSSDADGLAVVLGAAEAEVPVTVLALGAMERRSVGPVVGWSRGVSEMIGIGAVVGPSATVVTALDPDAPEPPLPVPALSALGASWARGGELCARSRDAWDCDAP